eukprot:3789354-Amphidinium_carterae.1
MAALKGHVPVQLVQELRVQHEMRFHPLALTDFTSTYFHSTSPVNPQRQSRLFHGSTCASHRKSPLFLRWG